MVSWYNRRKAVVWFEVHARHRKKIKVDPLHCIRSTTWYICCQYI
jgi:hypothetical protein